MSNTIKLPTGPAWRFSPDWATHFAINSDGFGWWYMGEPMEDAARFYPMSEHYQNAGKFDASDWQNSLQKRPETI